MFEIVAQVLRGALLPSTGAAVTWARLTLKWRVPNFKFRTDPNAVVARYEELTFTCSNISSHWIIRPRAKAAAAGIAARRVGCSKHRKP